MREDEIDSFESNDEMNTMAFILQDELNMSEKSSTSENENCEASDREGSENEEKVERNQNLTQKKECVGLKIPS